VTCRPFHGPPKEDEYVKEAQYPEIPKYRDENEKEYDSLKEVIKNLQTVEEKQIYLNKPKYYGWYSCVMNPEAVKPATLNFMQYVTNTTIVEDALPERFSEYDEVAKREAETLEPIVKRHLVLQSLTESGLQVKNDQAKFSQAHGNFQETHNYHSAMIQTNLTSLHRLLHVHLAQRYPHLTSPKTSTATLPRVDAFWMRSGMQPDMKMVKKRKAKNKYKEKRNYPEEDIKEDDVWKEYDNCFQIKGNHAIHMRSDTMFDSFIDVDDDTCQSGSVPPWNYASKTSSYPHYCQHGTNVPGTWTGASQPFVNLGNKILLLSAF